MRSQRPAVATNTAVCSELSVATDNRTYDDDKCPPRAPSQQVRIWSAGLRRVRAARRASIVSAEKPTFGRDETQGRICGHVTSLRISHQTSLWLASAPPRRDLAL